MSLPVVALSSAAVAFDKSSEATCISILSCVSRFSMSPMLLGFLSSISLSSCSISSASCCAIIRVAMNFFVTSSLTAVSIIFPIKVSGLVVLLASAFLSSAIVIFFGS